MCYSGHVCMPGISCNFTRMHTNRILFIVFLFALSGCVIFKSRSNPYTALNGTWRPVSEILAGNPFPETLWANQRLMMYDSSYIVSAETVDAGKAILTDSTMDIYGLEGPNAGRHFKARYKLVNDTLTICYDLTGTLYPEAFISGPENYYFLATFVREK